MKIKRSSTSILKGVIIIIGLIVLALCIFAIAPALFSGEAGYYAPFLIIMLVSAIPFYIALGQSFKLLRYIDQNNAFSDLSVQALKHIKYCAVIISALYAIAMPYVHLASQENDAPGVVILGLLVVFGSLVIATFAALLEKVLRNAIDIKLENELVV